MTEEMKANDASRFMVVRYGKVSADTHFTVVATYEAEGEAGEAARDFAIKDEQDRTYGVFQKVGSASAARQVTWKGAAR